MYSVFSVKLISDDAAMNNKRHVFARKLARINDNSSELDTLRQARAFVNSTYRKHAENDAQIRHTVDVDSIVFYRNVADKAQAQALKASIQRSSDDLSARERKIAIDDDAHKRNLRAIEAKKIEAKNEKLRAALNTTASDAIVNVESETVDAA